MHHAVPVLSIIKLQMLRPRAHGTMDGPPELWRGMESRFYPYLDRGQNGGTVQEVQDPQMADPF